MQRRLKEAHRVFHDFMETCARRLALLRFRVTVGERKAGFLSKLRHGLRKAYALLFDQKGEMVARRAAAEAMIAALAVFGMERGRLLAMEGAAGPVIAAAGIGFPLVPGDLPPDHIGDRDAGADVVEEGGRESHDSAFNMRFAAGQRRAPVDCRRYPLITGGDRSRAEIRLCSRRPIPRSGYASPARAQATRNSPQTPLPDHRWCSLHCRTPRLRLAF